MARELHEYTTKELERELRNRTKRDEIVQALIGTEIRGVTIERNHFGECEMIIEFYDTEESE